MTIAKVQFPPDTIVLPYDLESDEPELESDLHRDQIDLLLKFEQTQQQLEQERQAREALLTKLREKGLDPDEI
jgi:hypothetical protein